MSGRHRAPGKAPLPLAHHFWWTLIVSGFLMVAVLTVSYVAQDNDPSTVEQVCEPRWSAYC